VQEPVDLPQPRVHGLDGGGQLLLLLQQFGGYGYARRDLGDRVLDRGEALLG